MFFQNSLLEKQRILEEHWLYRFSAYRWSWGVDDVVEGRGFNAKWKEEEATLDSGKG